MITHPSLFHGGIPMNHHFHHHHHHAMHLNQMHQHAMQHAQNQSMNQALRAQQEAAQQGHLGQHQATELAPPAGQQNAAMNVGLFLQAVLAKILPLK
ncbi:MAG TPA: hypothetical protein ENK30_01930 [Anaerolineae bacterium]|nr:hypothetical protein [Anaerolineae bacterium]